MRIPRLESQRLMLRPYEPRDCDKFVELNQNPAVRRHVGGPISEAAATAKFATFMAEECEPGNEVWAVADKSTGDYIGHCWLVTRPSADCPEFGVLIDSRWWRQGLGTEVTRTVMDYALTPGGHSKVTATVDLDHAASMALFVAWYDYCRRHETLKDKTPAMAAGLAAHVWTITELLTAAA